MRNAFKLAIPFLAASTVAASADPLPADVSKVEYGPILFQLVQNDEIKGEMYYELERRGDEIVVHDAATLLPGVRESATSVIDAKTLAPKSVVLDGDFNRMIFDADLQFSDEGVSGAYTLKRPTEITRTEQPFEMEMQADAILRPAFFGLVSGLPLEEGASFSFTWFAPLGQRFAEVTFAITGVETVSVPAGSFETFVGEVRAQPENVIYITTEAPHRVVRIDVPGQNMRFERLPEETE